MGAPFRLYLPSSRVYICSSCSTHLAADEDVISRSFHGRIGRAYLFGTCMLGLPTVIQCSDPDWTEKATNVIKAEPESRTLLSGMHKISNLHCRVCNQLLGWEYIEAQPESQKYKEVRCQLKKKNLQVQKCWLRSGTSSSGEITYQARWQQVLTIYLMRYKHMNWGKIFHVIVAISEVISILYLSPTKNSAWAQLVCCIILNKCVQKSSMISIIHSLCWVWNTVSWHIAAKI